MSGVGQLAVVVLRCLVMMALAWTAVGCASADQRTDDLSANGPVSELATPIHAGDVAPAWSGTDMLDGARVEFPGVLQGKPAVVVFWASWCPYCKAFMPYLEAIQWDYGDSGVQIISLNAKQRGRGDPVAYAAALGFPLIAISDADSIAELYGIESIPGIMVVDGDARVVYRRGPTDLPAGQEIAQLWEREIREALDSLVSVDSL